MHTDEIIAFVKEREAIRMRKEIILYRDSSSVGETVLSAAGEAVWCPQDADRDWTLNYLTDDPILAKFKFCNVRREDDRVTRWIRENIIVPYAEHDKLWLMLAIARTINWPPTLKFLMNNPDGWPPYLRFSPERLTRLLEEWKSARNKVYTGAYMIRAASSPSEHYFRWSKQRYIAEIVIGNLWKQHKAIASLLRTPRLTSQAFWDHLQKPYFTGWGPFMAYQVVVDMQHTRYLQDSPDRQTWCAPGPGTLRGLNRWVGNPVNASVPSPVALQAILELREQLNAPGAIWPWLQPIYLSDVCNILCEFDKFERVRLGEGRPRSLYKPEKEF